MRTGQQRGLQASGLVRAVGPIRIKESKLAKSCPLWVWPSWVRYRSRASLIGDQQLSPALLWPVMLFALDSSYQHFFEPLSRYSGRSKRVALAHPDHDGYSSEEHHREPSQSSLLARGNSAFGWSNHRGVSCRNQPDGIPPEPTRRVLHPRCAAFLRNGSGAANTGIPPFPPWPTVRL